MGMKINGKGKAPKGSPESEQRRLATLEKHRLKKKQRYAEDAEYRERKKAVNLTYRENRHVEQRAAARQRWRDDSEYRAKRLAACKLYNKANQDKLKAYRDEYAVRPEAIARKLARLQNPVAQENDRKQRKIHWAKIRDAAIVKNRIWKQNNPDKVAEYQKKRYADPDSRRKVLSKNRNRKANLRASGGKHTVAQIDALYERQKHKCLTCKTLIRKSGRLQYHIDHVMPIKLGGSNDISNLQLLCGPCNNKKRAKHPDQWAKENGLLFC